MNSTFSTQNRILPGISKLIIGIVAFLMALAVFAVDAHGAVDADNAAQVCHDTNCPQRSSAGLLSTEGPGTFFAKLFDTSDFPARWNCGTWSTDLGWLHIISDIAIFGAYFAIPIVLLYFLLQRTDLAFPKIIWLFAAFIMFCGFGHLIEAGIFWWPAYRFSGLVKAATAIVSWITVLALIRLVPEALKFPSAVVLARELQHSKERLHFALDSGQIGVWEWNLKTDAISWDRKTREIFQVAPEKTELNFGDFNNRLHPDDYDRINARLRECIETGETFNEKFRVYDAGGDIRYIESQGRVVFDKKNQAEQFIGVCHDFTEKQIQENALLESARNYRSTFEQVAIGIAHIAPDGHWLRVNNGLCGILGYSSEELLKLTYRDLTHPDDLEECQNRLEQLIDGVLDSYSVEKRYIHKNGSAIWTNVTVSLVRDPSGAPRYFITTIEDIQGRKEYERSLEMYNQRVKKLSLVASKTKHPVIICDAEGKIEWVNDAFISLTGYQLNDVIEKPLTGILSGPNTDAETIAEIRYHIELKESIATEIPIYDIEGYEYWIELKIDPVLGDEGELIHFIATQIDITARKQSELALRKVNTQFSKLLKADILGIMTCHYDGSIEQANDELLRILGYTPDDLAAGLIDLNALTPPEWQQRDEAIQRELELTGAVKPVEKEFFRKNGSRVPVVFGATRLDETGDLYLGFVLDATEQKLKEAEAAERTRELQIATEQSKANERRIEAIVNTAVDPIITISGLGLIKSFNPAAERLFGYSVEEIIDQNIKILMPSPYRDEHDSYLKRYLETGKQNVIGSGREAVGQRKDGTTFPLHLSVSQVVMDEVGKDKEILFTGIIRDLTEQKQKDLEAEQRTRDLQIATQKSKANERRAALASKTKSEFLANMSHELRTPLNGVIGMTELLAGTNLSQRQQEFVDACRNSGESLLKLINDILDFSKIEAGKLELDLHDFDLENLVVDTVRTMVWRSTEKKLELPCYVAPESRVVLKGDSYRLRQILVNLVGNAIKFTEMGEVVVRAEAVSQENDQIQIRFSVSDTGIGISEDKLNQLFQSFAQGDSSTTRVYGGTGLGLTISQSLVELMGGEIGIESQQGVGSTFWFILPFTVVSESPLTSPDEAALAGKRILIAEDNQTKRTILQKYMTEWNLDSVATESVDEALEVIAEANAENNPFDLIITDFDMPNRNGLDLAEALKDSTEKVVLLLSSSNMEFTDRELLEYGIDMIHRKPVQRQKLHEMICSLFSEDAKKPFETNVENDHDDKNEKRLPTTRILLAEDNNINLMYVTELMKQLGCMCDTATNGLEAVEAIQQHQYNLILMDCQMPEMDGFEATARIRQLEAEGKLKGHTPIVALTANAIKGDRERCLKIGMDEYLSKPVQKKQIIDVLERIMTPKEPEMIEANKEKTEMKTTNTQSAPTPIHPVLLLERCFGSLDLAGSLLDELEASGRERVAEIRQQAQTGNARGMALAAHSLKGATGILCASELTKMSKTIEAAGMSEDMSRVEDLINEITNEMERCLRGLPKLREDLRLLKEGN